MRKVMIGICLAVAVAIALAQATTPAQVSLEGDPFSWVTTLLVGMAGRTVWRLVMWSLTVIWSFV